MTDETGGGYRPPSQDADEKFIPSTPRRSIAELRAKLRLTDASEYSLFLQNEEKYRTEAVDNALWDVDKTYRPFKPLDLDRNSLEFKRDRLQRISADIFGTDRLDMSKMDIQRLDDELMVLEDVVHELPMTMLTDKGPKIGEEFRKKLVSFVQ